jgi:hypothetical protein
LVPAQLPQLATCQRTRCRGAILDSADVQGRAFKVDLFPTNVDHLGRSEPMPESEEGHESVARTVPIGLGRLDQLFDLGGAEVLPGPQGGIL